MKKVTIPMENHFAMFETITHFLTEHTNLSLNRAMDVTTDLLLEISDKAQIEPTCTEEDMDFISEGFAEILATALLSE